MDNFTSRVEELRQLRDASRVVAAFSGGKDSVAMLLFLLELAEAGIILAKTSSSITK